ncbi:MAG: hypothetical protein HYV07_31945 [Deltaproteobacteria bacterium]|nr:hypothetical protein [Deltaproteobacteria bacterium]
MLSKKEPRRIGRACVELGLALDRHQSSDGTRPVDDLDDASLDRSEVLREVALEVGDPDLLHDLFRPE